MRELLHCNIFFSHDDRVIMKVQFDENGKYSQYGSIVLWSSKCVRKVITDNSTAHFKTAFIKDEEMTEEELFQASLVWSQPIPLELYYAVLHFSFKMVNKYDSDQNIRFNYWLEY